MCVVLSLKFLGEMVLWLVFCILLVICVVIWCCVFSFFVMWCFSVVLVYICCSSVVCWVLVLGLLVCVRLVLVIMCWFCSIVGSWLEKVIMDVLVLRWVLSFCVSWFRKFCVVLGCGLLDVMCLFGSGRLSFMWFCVLKWLCERLLMLVNGMKVILLVWMCGYSVVCKVGMSD